MPLLTLSPGTRLGPYEVLAPLGTGGMGEVYRARDSKLNRDVAIKVLLFAVANDPDRLARFSREAQVLASLNHPNIAHIYGLEDAGGVPALVMELVEGPTLADRIAKGAIPIDEALPIAKQIAEALEAAHEQGIIHRDLKPANIKVRPDGAIKVLDFGLAKAMDPTGASSASATMSPTLSMHATQAGVILGTAAYMSPEQAAGKPVDKRSDLWAFGVVLLEMLTGRQVFDGETVSHVLAAVLTKDPDWTALPANTPAPIRKLLRRCLEKNRKRRLADAADARLEIEDALTAPAVEASPAGAPRRVAARPIAFALAGTALVAALVGAFATWGLTRPAGRAPALVTRFQMDIRPADQLGTGQTGYARPSRTALALSPNGRLMVFSATRGTVTQLFSRALDQADAAPVPGTEGGFGPFFSPDAKWIGFWAGGKIKKVPVDGGVPFTIYEGPAVAEGPAFGQGWGASWAEDGTIFFSARPNEISKVSSEGGTPATMATAEVVNGEQLMLPQSLPGGKAVLFTAVRSSDWDTAKVVLYSLNTGERRVLIDGAADARYVRSGHLVYIKTGTIMAVPFDLGTLQVTGAPVALVEGVMQAVNMPTSGRETGAGQFVISESGTLLYLTGGTYPSQESSLVWVDRKGAAQTLPGAPVRPQFMPRLSPDGEKVAVVLRGGSRNMLDLGVYDTVHGSQTRLTFKGANEWPVWSPDGKRLVYASNVSGHLNLYTMSASDPGSPAERLTISDHDQAASSWTAAGNLITFFEGPPGGKSQIWVLPMDGDRKARLFVESPESRFLLRYPQLSPDGRWMAYVSNESGSDAVYVQPYPGPGERYRVSLDGAVSPIWVASGRELLYRTRGATADSLFSVAITSLNPFRWVPPRLVFQAKPGEYGDNTPIRGWDSTLDGQRFLMTRAEESKDKPVTQIQVVLNWTDEVKRRVLVK